MVSMLPLKRTPVLVRKSLLRATPVVALSFLGSSLTTIAFGMPNPSIPPSSFTWERNVLVFLIYALCPFLIFLHHMVRLWQWRFWPTVLELMVLVGEGTALIAYRIIPTPPSAVLYFDGAGVGDITKMFWMYPASLILLTVLSLLSLLAMVWDSICGRPIDIVKPYHCLAGEPRPGLSVLVGDSALKPRFSTDKPWFISFRALVAAILFLALILAGISGLGQGFAQLNGPIETQTFYITSPTNGTAAILQLDAVLVLVGFPQGFGYNLTEVVDRYLKVAIISNEWTRDGVRTNQSDSDCKSYTNITEALQLGFVECPQNLTSETFQVSYLVSFDFSPFMPGINNGTLPPDLGVTIYLGFSEYPEDMYLNTIPIYLFPGSRIFGQAELIYRDVFERDYKVFFGSPSYRRRLIARIHSSVVEDDRIVPLPNNSTGVAKISPLYLNPTHYERDQIDVSIFGNFASLGGIWTFMNGIFATIFGSTLYLTLFNRKPLSVFGLVHLLQRGKVTRIRTNDRITPEEQQQIIGLLRDHLLDVHSGECSGTPSDPATQHLLPKYSAVPVAKRDGEMNAMEAVYPN